MDDIIKTMRISGAGMRAQGNRLRVISQNIANANSLPQEPGQNPYRRKVVTFKNVLDRSLGLETVRTGKVRPDRSDSDTVFIELDLGGGANDHRLIASAVGRNDSQIDDIDKGRQTPGNGRAATTMEEC